MWSHLICCSINKTSKRHIFARIRVVWAILCENPPPAGLSCTWVPKKVCIRKNVVIIRAYVQKPPRPWVDLRRFGIGVVKELHAGTAYAVDRRDKWTARRTLWLHNVARRSPIVYVISTAEWWRSLDVEHTNVSDCIFTFWTSYSAR